MTSRFRLLMVAAAIIFLSAHALRLPQTLEDIDSINFALGVESFDVRDHRPHPPGYPVFVALAKVSTHAVAFVRPGWDRDRRAAAGLALWGVLTGALAFFVFTKFWEVVGLPPLDAVLASIVAITSPLFWLTADRPLTDTPGLVAAVAVQTWLLSGIRRIGSDRGQLGTLLWGAVGAGFIIGIRSQTMWLTGPFLGWALVLLIGRRHLREAAMVIGAAGVGVLVWLMPLVWMTGGAGPYLNAIRSQGAEDFSGVQMLARSFTGPEFVQSIESTFMAPWQHRSLGHVVLGLALIGTIVLLWRQRRLFGVVALGILPYLVFHLAFHETVTIRYALPLLVPVAGLAVIALSRLGTAAAVIGATAVTVASLVLVEPRLSAYAADGAPVFRAFQDMQRALRHESEAPVLKMHHQVWWGVRRVVDWYRPVWDVGPQPFPGDREWLGVVEHFRTGATRPVWFLAHVSRTDLAVFDPRTTMVSGNYQFSPALRNLIGGARLDSLTWWSIRRPGWMLGTGWSLTPELAGMTSQDRTSGQSKAVEAFLVRQPGPVRVVIGGRYLGPENGLPVLVSVLLDGRPVTEWRAVASPRWFVEWFDLPQGTMEGSGPYATLTVRVTGESGRDATSLLGLEQFDSAGPDGSISALTSGWYEQETDPTTGLTWHWTSARSTIEVRGAEHDRTLRLLGESPLKYFDQAPHVTVRAGERVLMAFTPTADFSKVIRIPADVLKTAGGSIVIETSRTFRPSDRGSSPDRRSLGLRLFAVEMH